ncbi:hypothetical protein ACFQZQ_10280 [Lysobacter koreensis]|uniref:Sulfotransferase n=1 Tax=Lysobacter koreensis TaxID=266122 RepID=A0ABW2YMN0_9GAMM
MSPSPLTDPEFLPFKLDLVGRRVLWLRLTAVQRREAAFLDDRALPANVDGGWLPLDTWLATPAAVASPAAAIFHIGHCGSTLLSRVLDAWPQVQGLREPLPLRTLAEAWPALAQPESRLSPDEAGRLLQAAWTRWSQPLPPATRSVVKATSSCNGLIAPLLESQPGMRAVLLDIPLRPYLATLLKSPGSVLDAASAAGERLRDLQARGIGEDLALHGLSLPQQCALGWLAERLRFDALAGGEHAARVLRVDFEALLAQPEATLHAIAAHFVLAPGGVPAALAAPAWGRYSKAQAHDYGRDDRAHDLALAAERHRDEIAQGVALVESLLQRHPALRAITG